MTSIMASAIGYPMETPTPLVPLSPSPLVPLSPELSLQDLHLQRYVTKGSTRASAGAGL